MELGFLTDAERLKAYNTIASGCNHLWSKNKLQKDKFLSVMQNFMELAEKDPYFLAHFTSYIVKKMPNNKDLNVLATFANSLSDADGTPFSHGSKYIKPNLRVISQAAINRFDPKLVKRVVEIANEKFVVGSRREGTHFSKHLKTAIKKWLKYREANPKALEGIRKAGFAKTATYLYKAIHIAPSTEAAGVLKWKQKDGRKIEKKDFFDFSGMNELQIAEKIRKEKLPPTGVIGALPDKLSPVIAAAILEQASGDQAVILSEMFESQGLLKNKEVKVVYNEKIKTAKTALDRVERFKKQLDEDIQKSLKTAKAESRKETVGDVGKIFLHIDNSGSMHEAIEIAKESGAIIAECVKNPEKNFHWGTFNTRGVMLPAPKTFEKDAFKAALYGVHAGGGTNCLALYGTARQLGCDVDVFITDQDHNEGTLERLMGEAHKTAKPRAVVIVNVGAYGHHLKSAFENAGIPVTEVNPNTLKESALVASAIKTALLGANAVIDEIMKEPLLELPKWWYTVK